MTNMISYQGLVRTFPKPTACSYCQMRSKHELSPECNRSGINKWNGGLRNYARPRRLHIPTRFCKAAS
ncbi:hypothetical protein DJ508_27590 [Klebsiella michiganensis]|nr:hypothetical protein DJ508_27590 [Klebsiella michiganensis]